MPPHRAKHSGIAALFAATVGFGQVGVSHGDTVPWWLAPDRQASDVATPRLAVAICSNRLVAELRSAAALDLIVRMGRECRVATPEATTELWSEEQIVVTCLRETVPPTLVSPTTCNLRVSVRDAHGRDLTAPPGRDAFVALASDEVERTLRPTHATRLSLHTMSGSAFTFRAQEYPLRWEAPLHGYGRRSGIWFPLAMFTSDLSGDPAGYRFGITPLAVAIGGKLFPLAHSEAYVGGSFFIGWNVLVPNDTLTLSNSTRTRINWQAAGFGVLLDGSGWAGLGVGIGHTFTSDARTDARIWLWVGPRLLGF